MPHYTIIIVTTNDGSEYPGRQVPVPEEVLTLFDAEPDSMIGLEAQEEPHQIIGDLVEVVYLRRKDIRSVTTWREVVSDEVDAPKSDEVSDLPDLYAQYAQRTHKEPSAAREISGEANAPEGEDDSPSGRDAPQE